MSCSGLFSEPSLLGLLSNECVEVSPVSPWRVGSLPVGCGAVSPLEVLPPLMCFGVLYPHLSLRSILLAPRGSVRPAASFAVWVYGAYLRIGDIADKLFVAAESCGLNRETFRLDAWPEYLEERLHFKGAAGVEYLIRESKTFMTDSPLSVLVVEFSYPRRNAGVFTLENTATVRHDICSLLSVIEVAAAEYPAPKIEDYSRSPLPRAYWC